MPTLAEVRPSVMLIVPLIIEKIYRHQILAKFTSSGFWRALYKIDFMRRYLHRVAGKKLMKVFGGRLRFLGIGGAKLDGGAEKFLLEARFPYAIGYGLTETAPCWPVRLPRRCAWVRPGLPRRASSCGWRTSIPKPARARSLPRRRAP